MNERSEWNHTTPKQVRSYYLATIHYNRPSHLLNLANPINPPPIRQILHHFQRIIFL